MSTYRTLDGQCIRLVGPQPRPTASRCSVVGFVTPPHRAAAGGGPSGGQGWPWRTGTSSGRWSVSEYVVETDRMHSLSHSS